MASVRFNNPIEFSFCLIPSDFIEASYSSILSVQVDWQPLINGVWLI